MAMTGRPPYAWHMKTAAGLVVAVGAFIALATVSYRITVLGGVFRTHTDAQVISAAERLGFSHEQAFFLRHGPLGGESICVKSGFVEKVCDFFAQHSSGWSPDDDYYRDCAEAGLQFGQCKMLRYGIEAP